MKRLAILFVLTVVLVNLLTTTSLSAVDASRFVSLEGRFAISLPDRYKQLTRLTVPTPFGNAYGHLYEWQTKGRTTFSIGYADSLKPIDDAEAVKQFFDGVTDHFRRLSVTANGNVDVVKTIALQQHPGIELRAGLSTGAFIQRTYLVSRRIYQTLVVVTNSQRDEGTAVSVLDSFKLLSDADITEEALKAAPGPLPQTPEAPRAGSDATDEGLRGPVKSVRTESQYVSETPFTREGPRSWLMTYNQKGNKLRSETYDSKNNLVLITVYGYLDGARVSVSKLVPRAYGPSLGAGAGLNVTSSKKKDPRYDRRFEFKYDEKNRLTEQTESLSNGDVLWRYVYNYEGNQKEEMVYPQNRSLTQRYVYILDDKGNAIERTEFSPDGTVQSKISYTYEFDSNSNWTKRTGSWSIRNDKVPQLEPPIVFRTVTYY